MPHETPLIATIVGGLVMAFILGGLAFRLRISPLIGYLLAGVLVGPFTPGYVADQELANELAELGIILLMFGVGLHFSLRDLMAVRTIAIPGAIVQILVAIAMGFGLSAMLGWPVLGGMVFGLALSVASTVVLLRALQERRIVDTDRGRIAVGWLIVEDLVMVLALVMLPALAGGEGGSALGMALALTMLKVGVFVVLMLVVGRRAVPWLLHVVAHSGSREMFRLAVLAIALGIAFGAAKLFGVSFALGAFFAGMILAESPLSQRATEETLPLRDAFAVLFFVSVGMLFDPHVLIDEPLKVLLVVAIVVVGKSLAATLIVLLFRYPLNTALTVSAGLAQIGEFSFILAALGMKLGLLPAEGQSLILAGALISMALNPLVFAAIQPARRWILRHSALARRLEASDDPLAELPTTTAERFLSGQVVLVGYGRVGRRIAAALAEAGVPYVVAEQNRELVEALRSQGVPAVSGDAADPAVLIQAHVARASMLVIATPDTLDVRQMAETANLLNPGIEIVVLTHNESEGELLQREQRIGRVFVGERELATAMVHFVLGRFGKA